MYFYIATDHGNLQYVNIGVVRRFECVVLFLFQQAKTMLLTVFSAASLLCLVHAYPYGPPVDMHPGICVDMTPVHPNTTPMTSAAPYRIKTSDTCYNANARIVGAYVQDWFISSQSCVNTEQTR